MIDVSFGEIPNLLRSDIPTYPPTIQALVERGGVTLHTRLVIIPSLAGAGLVPARLPLLAARMGAGQGQALPYKQSDGEPALRRDRRWLRGIQSTGKE